MIEKMETVQSVEKMQDMVSRLQRGGKTIALVPTMGSLHGGHISMIEKANKIADVTITSIFINPAQFGPSDDIIKYPNDLDNDLKLCQKEGVDIAFTPQVNSIYPADYSTYIQEELISKRLAGPARPQFFRGFATIINIFLNIIRPQYLVLGQKDIHQTAIIKKIVNDLHIPVGIAVMPVVREEDGLASSASNLRLEGPLRAEATKIHKALQKAQELVKNGTRSVDRVVAEVTQFLTQSLRIRVIYISIIDPETMLQENTINEGKSLLVVSAWCDQIRLNDNILL